MSTDYSQAVTQMHEFQTGFRDERGYDIVFVVDGDTKSEAMGVLAAHLLVSGDAPKYPALRAYVDEAARVMREAFIQRGKKKTKAPKKVEPPTRRRGMDL